MLLKDKTVDNSNELVTNFSQLCEHIANDLRGKIHLS